MLAGAAEKQGLLDLPQGQALAVEASGQLPIGRGEGALNARGIEQQTGHLIEVLGFGRFGLLDEGSLVGPEGLADLDVSALVLIASEAELN